MTSLDIVSARVNIETYIDNLDMPKELIRMILADIYKKVSDSAYQEAMKEAEEKEKEHAESEES